VEAVRRIGWPEMSDMRRRKREKERKREREKERGRERERERERGHYACMQLHAASVNL
jgi:hypothetical protein